MQIFSLASLVTRVKCSSVELECTAPISNTTSPGQIEQLEAVETQYLARHKQQPVIVTIPGGSLHFTTGLGYSHLVVFQDNVSLVLSTSGGNRIISNVHNFWNLENDVTKYIQLCLLSSSNDIEENPGPGR